MKIIFADHNELEKAGCQNDLWQLAGFECENCKCDVLNPHTGRCRRCDLPPEDMGYCHQCAKFWNIKPGSNCPVDGIKLVRHKAAMSLLRIGNNIFDSLLIVITTSFTTVLFGIDTTSESNLFYLCYKLVSFTYYVLFETLWQRTPAKFLTGTKVIDFDGNSPGFSTVVKRSLIRLIPFEQLSFLGERVYGWHDRWTETYVVKK